MREPDLLLPALPVHGERHAVVQGVGLAARLHRRNTACLAATRASLRAFLPGAAFPLQRDVLYRLDVLSALLSATLTHSPAQLEALRLANGDGSLLETLTRHLRAVEIVGTSVYARRRPPP